MQQTITISGMLPGGLGMFLLAVTMITDGLKATAGPVLRELLANWTRLPLLGVHERCPGPVLSVSAGSRVPLVLNRRVAL